MGLCFRFHGCYILIGNKLVQLGQLPATNNAHHTFMSQLTSDIAATLKAYGINKGYNLSDEFYSDMAWAGLTEIENPNGNGRIPNPIFTSLIPSTVARQRIITRLKVEESRNPLNGVQPSGNDKSCNR